MAVDWLAIVPSALVTRVLIPDMAVALPDTLPSVAARSLVKSVMAVDWLAIVPSALVTRVLIPDMAVALPEALPSTAAISLARFVMLLLWLEIVPSAVVTRAPSEVTAVASALSATVDCKAVIVPAIALSASALVVASV